MALESKFVPLTVSVNAAPPAVADEGVIPVMVGVPDCMVMVLAPLVPAVVDTEMLAVPAEAIRLAGTAAVSCVALT